MLVSLLYVSRRLLDGPDESADIDAIVAVARARNPALDVTGCLIATTGAFAQILEGPQDSVETLMRSIRADPRHADIDVLTYREIEQRRFTRWAMAYSGPASYITRLVKPLLGTRTAELAATQIRQLIAFMEEFGRDEAG